MSILIFLLGAILFFLCLVAIPVDFGYRFDSGQKPCFRCHVGWFFSLVTVSLPSRERNSVARKKRIKKKDKGKREGYSPFLNLLSRPLFLQCSHLIKKVLRSIHFKKFRAEITAGLGDPADTGLLYGAFSMIVPVFGSTREIRQFWIPDFGNEPVLKGTSDGLIRFHPIEVLPAFLSFFFSKPVRRALKKGVGIWKSRK